MFIEILKIILKTLNLFIFLYIIYYFARKPLGEFLKNYKDEILNKREEAKKKEEEAVKIEKEAMLLKEKLQNDLGTIKEKFNELKAETEKELDEETKNTLAKIQKEYEFALKEKEEEVKKEIFSYVQERVTIETARILRETLNEEEQKRYLLKIIGEMN